MKIAYISNSRFPSERAHMLQIVHMCKAFTDLGHTVTLYVTDRPTPIMADPDEYYGMSIPFTVTKVATPDIAGNASRIPRFLWPVAYTIQRWFFARRALRKIKKDGFDVIYGRDEWVLWFMSFTVALNRLIYESHEAKWSLAAKRILKQGIKCVAISEGIRDRYVSLAVPTVQILVAHDAIDDSFFNTLETKVEARARLGISSDKPVVMYIGGLDTWKGTDVFCAAATLAPEFQWIVIGGTDTKVAQYQQQYPAVVFLGSRPYRELRHNQQAADVLVIPNTAKNKLSAEYTSPLKLFAHMTSGIPLIVSNIPSISVVLGSKYKYMFTPDSSRSLLKMVKSVFQDSVQAATYAECLKEKSKLYTWFNRSESIISFLQTETYSKNQPLASYVPKPIKYLFSGGVAAATHLGILYVLTDIFHVWYLLSSTLGFFASVSVGFVLQKFLTFSNKSTKQFKRQFSSFVSVGVINVMLNGLGMYVLVDYIGIGYFLAQILVAGTIAFWSFFIYQYVIFK